MQPITREEAATRRWDVIIAGSSFAAMFFLRGLPQGLSVLVVEKGPVVDHAAQIAAREMPGAEDFAQENLSGREKTWVAHSIWGGNSNCWWACTPRFHPHDFELHSRYGAGEDWPLTYDDLAEAYEEVERLMEIAGGGSDHILPRRAEFPYPPHLPSRSDRVLQARSTGWVPQPTARANGGSRAQCCANGVCSRCPVDSKFTILNAAPLWAREGAFALTGAPVQAVSVTAGRADGVVLADGTALAGDLVALGCNAVFNAGILMRSGLDHPELGRGLHEQASITADLDGDALGYYGGTSITGNGYDLYDGPHRAQAGAVLMEVHNAPVTLRPEHGKWLNRARLKLIVEDLRQARNRVVLDDAGRERLIWHGHSDYALAGLERAKAALPGLLPPGVSVAGFSDIAPSEAHIMGTHVMGADPARHVTTPGLEVHGLPGAYALGAGNFPTSGPANPTLTLSALSLRAARGLA